MPIVTDSRKLGKKRRGLPLFLFYLLTLTLALPARAIPLTERLPASGGAPLSILDSEPGGVYVPTFGDFKDKYIFTFDGAVLTIIDTETWAEHETQPDDFSDTIADVTLLGDGITLVVALSNGNLARIDLSDEDSFVNTDTDDDSSDSDSSDDSDNDTSSDDEEEEDEINDSRESDSSEDMTSAGITAIAADPGSTAETVYMINGSGQYYYQYNFATNALTELSLSDSSDDSSDDDSTTTSYTPVDIAYANIGSDQVLVSTDTGDLLVFSAGSTSFTAITLAARDSSESTPSFSSIAMSTDNEFAFVIDTANDFVWVYSAADVAFVDQIDDGTSLDPIEFSSTDENADLTGIAIYHDATDDEDFAYVAGSLGLSVIDASDPGTKADGKIVDTNESTTDVFEPITLTETPALVAASSEDDGYVYAVNSDGTIAVVSDNPFVTISASTASTVTEAAPTFALTFQSDEAGTYIVKANSDPTGESGTTLTTAAGTVTDADNDVTTDTFTIADDADHEVFIEGSNKIFVFVTDADGFTGRDAYVLKVDRPPGEITIESVNFGSRKVYVNFDESSDEDIDYYTLYAKPAANQNSPTCDETLDFTSSDTVTSTVTPSTCTSSPCEGTVTGLENDIAYCVGINATDLSAQAGPLSAYTVAVTTQATVGPAEFLGETGCALNGITSSGAKSMNNPQPYPLRIPVGLAIGIIGLLAWWGFRGGRMKSLLLPWFIPLLLFAQYPARAAEVPIDPEHFSFELRGGLWLPTRPQIKNFFSACCNPVGEIEFGYLHDNRYNAIFATGFSYLTGSAIGVTNGLASGDRFSLAMIPIRADFAYRLDFKENQLFVPYVRAGLDAVLFRENSDGADGAIQGCKFGLHGGGGVAILLDKIDTSTSMETSGSGFNDVYLTLEGRFAYLNSFSSTGLDLTGFYPYAGVMFQF